jgi:glycosyltransferase involved in cell wall biosynthesis
LPPDTVVIVSTFNEEDRLPATLSALGEAFPGARVLVADDGSRDGTPHLALQAGAELVRSPRVIGKGGATTVAAERVLPLALESEPPVFLLCDGDLGPSARELPALVATVRADECDVAVGAFARRVGGGFGLAVGFSRWASARLGGVELQAPISGQRALNARAFQLLVPFAPRFGMETAMNIDAGRAGLRVRQVELDLEHRPTGRTLRGFVHRARQLADFAAVYANRR